MINIENTDCKIKVENVVTMRFGKCPRCPRVLWNHTVGEKCCMCGELIVEAIFSYSEIIDAINFTFKSGYSNNLNKNIM